MRVTKKLLKTAKTGFNRRLKDLFEMYEHGKLQNEFKRCFPHYEGEPGHSECLRLMINDLVDLCYPDHWSE